MTSADDLTEVRTEWASLEISPNPASEMFRYRTLGEETVRGILAVRAQRGFRDVLLRRTVTCSPWEEVPDARTSPARTGRDR